jgi:thermitase
VVASAGNSNADARDHIPSNVDGVIVVAAVDQNLGKARFSNTNTSLALPLAAPGVDILSLKPNNKYVPLSGTSMSTPMVSGLIGILRSFNPDLTTQQAYDILHETGKTLDDSPRIGRLINAEAAIQTVLGGASTTMQVVGSFPN